MACPRCGCKVVYQFDAGDEDCGPSEEDRLQRCAACGSAFDLDDQLDEDDEDG